MDKGLRSRELVRLLSQHRDNSIMVEITDDEGPGVAQVQPYAVRYDPAGDNIIIEARQYYQ